jgi:uncharacterized repeat protein (TIGR03803 family)
MTNLRSVRQFALVPTRGRKARPVGKLSLSKMTGIVAVFCVAATIAAPAQTYTDLYNFGTASGDPNGPFENVIAQGRDGNMYSTTEQYFTGGPGEVFKITPTGTLTVLHNFDGTDGQGPFGGLTLGTDGRFYGTTAYGGKFGYGTIFSMTAQGKLATLYSFTNGADGSEPIAPPVEGLDGNFYGTTVGASGNNGSVYQITPAGAFTTLHSFDGTDGANPYSPLVKATDGNFYGTTHGGGTNGEGTVFKINSLGAFALLHNFASGDGLPYAGLIQGSSGSLYGVTSYEAGGGGDVFKISTAGDFRVIHAFTGGSDGENPIGGLVQATDGNIYGTNDIGPLDFVGGVIFRITPSEAFTTLYDFDYTQGGSAQTTLLQHTNGVLYGETCCGGNFSGGVFYSISVGLGPFVTFLPAARPVGGVVEILGQGFTGTTGVSFNGTAAAFTVESDTYLTATVPAGASTGSIIVTEPGGTLTSNKTFRVVPQVTSFSPTSGPVSTSVVITGESFIGVIDVHFGNVKVTSFTVDSDTQITATVPAGAETGKISVCTAGGSGDSATSFTVTP